VQSLSSSVSYGRSLLGNAAFDRFVEVKFADLPEVIQSEMQTYFSCMLREGVQPSYPGWPMKLKPGVDLHVRVATACLATENDLVEYQWSSDGRPHRVISSRNAIRIDFDLNAITQCSHAMERACVLEASRWVDESLKFRDSFKILSRKIDYNVVLPWPDEFVDGMEFSSAPDRDIRTLPGTYHWYERVDAFVDHSVLSLLAYKKDGQVIGYQDGSKWFPDDFRAVVLERMREQAATDEATAPQLPQSSEPESERRPPQSSEPESEPEK
jgi:hypothetical protein